MPRAHEPERTCVGCRERAPKRALLRIARAADGTLGIDPHGRVAGRGAYIHRDRACVDAAFARGAVARALRTGADPDTAARLRQDVEGELSA